MRAYQLIPAGYPPPPAAINALTRMPADLAPPAALGYPPPVPAFKGASAFSLAPFPPLPLPDHAHRRQPQRQRAGKRTVKIDTDPRARDDGDVASRNAPCAGGPNPCNHRRSGSSEYFLLQPFFASGLSFLVFLTRPPKAPNAITSANFRRIEAGMSQAELRSLLGVPEYDVTELGLVDGPDTPLIITKTNRSFADTAIEITDAKLGHPRKYP